MYIQSSKQVKLLPFFLNRWETNWSRHANGVYTETGRAPCADLSSWISNTSKPLGPPLLSPPQGSSLSAGGPQGLLEQHCRRVDRAQLNRFQHTLTLPQTRPILQPETLPSAKKKRLRERLNYVNSPTVYCVYGKLSAKEELLRKDSGYKNILMRQGVVNDTYSRLKHWHAKARLEFTKNWEVFEQNNDFLMVFLIQNLPSSAQLVWKQAAIISKSCFFVRFQQAGSF